MFPERAVVELVYKYTADVLKSELITKVRFKFFGPQTYTYIMDTNTDHFTPFALNVQGNN